MIRVEDLALTYRAAAEPVPAVRGITLKVDKGLFYTLLGPSGWRQDDDAALHRRA